MTGKQYVTSELFLRNSVKRIGRFDMPVIARQKIDTNSLELIRFSDVKADDENGLHKTVHFFEWDFAFDEVWNNPEKYVNKLSNYKQILTPDFSMYADMPVPLQIYNNFRGKYLGAFFQGKGLTVIPTVNWSTSESYGFCFDGIEQGGVVAISTLGCSDNKTGFLLGFKEMIRRIEPKLVINYAKAFDEMYKYVKIIEVPYKHYSYEYDKSIGLHYDIKQKILS